MKIAVIPTIVRIITPKTSCLGNIWIAAVQVTEYPHPQLFKPMILRANNMMIRALRYCLAAMFPVLVSTTCFADAFGSGIAAGVGSTAATGTNSIAPDFSSNDFKNSGALILKLAKHTDPVSDYLWGRLSEPTQLNLKNYAAQTRRMALRPDLTDLLKDLNVILKDGSVYEINRFKSVRLSPEAQKLLAAKPEGLYLSRLNRLLLQSAYPAEIWRMPDALIIPGTKSYVIIDYRESTIALYDEADKPSWSADMGSALAKVNASRRGSRVSVRREDVGEIRSVEFKGDHFLVMAGSHQYFTVKLKTGVVEYWGSD